MIRTFQLPINNNVDENDPFTGLPCAVASATRATMHTTLDATPCQLVFGRDAIMNEKHEPDWESIRAKKQKLINANNAKENAKEDQIEENSNNCSDQGPLNLSGHNGNAINNRMLYPRKMLEQQLLGYQKGDSEQVSSSPNTASSPMDLSNYQSNDIERDRNQSGSNGDRNSNPEEDDEMRNGCEEESKRAEEEKYSKLYDKIDEFLLAQEKDKGLVMDLNTNLKKAEIEIVNLKQQLELKDYDNEKKNDEEHLLKLANIVKKQNEKIDEQNNEMIKLKNMPQFGRQKVALTF